MAAIQGQRGTAEIILLWSLFLQRRIYNRYPTAKPVYKLFCTPAFFIADSHSSHNHLFSEEAAKGIALLENIAPKRRNPSVGRRSFIAWRICGVLRDDSTPEMAKAVGKFGDLYK